MKFLLTVFLSFYSFLAFSQQKKQPKVVRDQFNIQGNPTINIYYTTPPTKGEKRQKQIDATVGYFSKIKDTTSSFPFFRIGSNTSMGNSEGDISIAEPIDPIRVVKRKGQILIFATVRDSKGDPLARLSGNSWEISNKAGIEYNNDGSGFEITAGERVVFQINIIKDTVFYYGMMCGENGQCTYLGPRLPYIPVRKMQGTQRFILPNDFLLTPLFKYPRYKYLGVRESVYYPNKH